MDSIQIGLTLRDWIALGGIVLILGVLIDAYRRLKQDQNEIVDNTSCNNSFKIQIEVGNTGIVVAYNNNNKI